MTALWQGNNAALSLTFDDALPSQLYYAVPRMDKYNIKGTFFGITDCPEYPLNAEGWRPVFERGHEIGSHSVTHRKAAQLSPAEAIEEAKVSKAKLEKLFAQPVTSFCYPYTDAPSHLYSAVAGAGYKQARGGRVARADKFILPRTGANMLNLPCYHVSNCVFENNDFSKQLEELLARKAWLTLMFHAVGDHTGWDNVNAEIFEQAMATIAHCRDKRGLWVAPFGTVGENLRQVGA